MSVPQLPPPPGASEWLAASPSPGFPSRSPIVDRPAWRQGRPGWAVLHLAIGLGIGFLAFFVSAVIGVIGRTQTQIDNADDGPIAIGAFLVVCASVVGWFLFAYVGWSLGRRWFLFGLLVGGSVAIAAILFSAASA